MKTSNHILTSRLGLMLIILAASISIACGAKIVRGAAPMVRMTELSHANNTIKLDLSIRNVNGVALDVQSIDFKFSDNDGEMFAYSGPVQTKIVANGTETWSMEMQENPATAGRLSSLENGDIKSLPYTLKGSVISKEEGTLHFEYDGHIYPLPGRPGHFR